VIFVDTNVFMYAVGGTHPLRAEAQGFFRDSLERGDPLVTSAEVLQELLHVYLPVGRVETLDAALRLVDGTISAVWSIEAEDVRFARSLLDDQPGLSARDLLHLAVCRRRSARSVKTFDRALAAAFGA
jgi:predicted nucleic acid-binding protein